MNRKIRKKRNGIYLKKSLMTGIALALVLCLLPVSSAFAEEIPEEYTKEVAEVIAEEETEVPAEEVTEPDSTVSGSEQGEETAKEETPKEETAEEEISEAVVSDETVSHEAKYAVLDSGNCGPNESASATWNLSDDGTLTISGSGSLGTYSGSDKTPWKDHLSEIRSLVVKEGITSITKFAFQGTSIKSASFPESLSSIGNNAFEQTLLETLDLKNTNVTSIGKGAFANCGELKSAVLSDGIGQLNHTFDWDVNLKSVVLGNAVTQMEGTFRGCTSLTGVNLPASLQTIGWGTFGGCTSLTGVSLPSGLTSIGESAFQECGITSILLPSSLTSIEKAAFYRSSLKSITIPKSVVSIGRSAFPAETTVTYLAAMTTMSDGSLKRTDLVLDVKSTVTAGQKNARKMLSLINTFRSGAEAWYYDVNNSKVQISGLKQLSYDYSLEKIAQQRAYEIALNFSHTRPDGSNCFELAVRDNAGNLVSAVAENIISGYSTYKKAMNALKETSYLYDGQGHRRNMLSSEYTAVGIGHVIFNGKHYWVQEFGTAKSNTAKTTAKVGKTTMSVLTWTGSDQINDYSVAGNPLKLGIKMKVAAPKATVTIRFAHGTYSGVKATKEASWSKSSKTKVAKLSGGKVTGKKAGTSYLGGIVCGQAVKAKVTVLKTPKLPKLIQGTRNVTVKWKKVKGATRYAVLRKTGKGKWKRIAVTKKLKFVDKKVKRGKKYTYTIRCISKNKKTYESNYNKKGRKIKF